MSTLKELKERVNNAPLGSNGKRLFSTELKKDILKYQKENNVTNKKILREFNIYNSLLCAWKKAFKGVITVREVQNGKSGVRYSITTKIAAAEQVLDYGKTASEVAKSLNCSYQSVLKWVDDYREGLFTLEHVTQISRKKFKTYDVLVEELKTLKQQHEAKAEEVKEALKREYDNKIKELGL